MPLGWNKKKEKKKKSAIKKTGELAAEADVRKSGVESREEDTQAWKGLEFPAEVGFDAIAVGTWLQVEAASSHRFSPCHKTQSIYKGLKSTN